MQKDLLFQIKKSLPCLLDLNEMVDDANKDNRGEAQRVHVHKT